jgi:hypothetical protein
LPLTAPPTPTPAELRRRAEQALSPHAPEPLRSALRHARLRLELDVGGWDTSTGHVRAHRVGFGTDAGTLALLRRSPSLFELLSEAIAAAFVEGHSLFDLRPYWGLAAGSRRADRPWPEADPTNDDALLEAALAYLEALGDEAGQRWLEGAGLTSWAEGGALRIELHGHGRVDAAPIERALADLLQGYEGRRVTVRVHSR